MKFIKSVLRPNHTQHLTADWVYDLAKAINPDAEVIGLIQKNSIYREEERTQYIGAVCGMWLAQREGDRLEIAASSNNMVQTAFSPTLRTDVELTAAQIKALVPHVPFVGAAWSYSYIVIVR